MSVPPHDAVVLAGGRGRRLGGDKPNVVLDDRRLLDHVLDATTGARRVVVVGPADLVPTDADGRVVTTREEPPFSGPAAGLAAGLARLDADAAADGDRAGSTPRPVLVLACDVPFASALVPLLLAAWTTQSQPPAGAPDGVCASLDGRAQWLVGVYGAGALRRALHAVRTGTGTSSRTGGADSGLVGAPLRQVMDQLRITTLDDPQRLSTDLDSWDDVATARRPHPGGPS